jgi:hypothetical protein
MTFERYWLEAIWKAQCASFTRPANFLAMRCSPRSSEDKSGDVSCHRMPNNFQVAGYPIVSLFKTHASTRFCFLSVSAYRYTLIAEPLVGIKRTFVVVPSGEPYHLSQLRSLGISPPQTIRKKTCLVSRSILSLYQLFFASRSCAQLFSRRSCLQQHM